jgi:hypothetical protein
MVNKAQPANLPLPDLWEERPISLARWRRHRSTLMAECDPGRRPPEWWEYEKKMPRPQEREAEALFEMGELREAELAKLMPIWREQYEHAQKPGFAYCIGHAKPTDTFASWIEGAEARDAYYDCAEIPRSLIKNWDEERDTTTRK